MWKYVFLRGKIDFLIPISLQPNMVDHRYFKMNSVRTNNKFDLSKVSQLGCKDIESRKFEFVGKTQFCLQGLSE